MDVCERDDDTRMVKWEGIVDLFFVVSPVIGFIVRENGGWSYSSVLWNLR